jgi:hypothetical protein
MPIRIETPPKFYILENPNFAFFLFSVIVLTFFNILDSVLKFSGVDTDPEPDRQALDADPDPAT